MTYSGALPTDRRTLVFCPVRGVAPDLEANVASILAQNHANYRAVFIVDSAEDPAYQVIAATGATIHVAGPAAAMGQKVHNLIEAVRRVGPEAEILVFCDADARFPPDWLRRLVGPLEDPSVGAATGYRWFLPPQGNLPTKLLSAWNATVAGFLGPHGRNFVWGGSTAIRTEAFETARVLERWQGALSDDYALTMAVRDAGLRIVYVPACLVPSYGAVSWGELFEFTTRQILITRVYAPRIWRVGIASYTLFTTTFLWLTVSMWGEPIRVTLWFAIYALAAVRANLRVVAARQVLAEPSLWNHRWFYRLAPPLVALLYQWNFLASALSRTLVWKGIRYRLVSASETRIER